MKKIKIAIIQPSIGNILAGAEIVAIELAKELKNYCDVTVLCEKKVAGIEDISLEIPVLNRNRVINSKNIFIKTLNFILGKFSDNPEIAIEYISSSVPVFFHLLFNSYDVLYPHYNWGGLWICNLVRMLKGTPILYTEHGSHLPKCYTRNLKFKPDKYIALNKEFENRIKQQYPNINVEYIPNGVNFNEFNPHIKPKEIDLPHPVILAVGRNDEIKRLNLVIDAVSKTNNVSLVLVSTGKNLDELEQTGNKKIGSNRFKLYRHVNPDKISEFYTACDIFTLPSDGEACSLVYIEAMACNKPSVAPNDAARSEIIGEAGILCNVTNIDEYVNALNKALSMDWGNIPYEKAKNLNWKAIAKQYYSVINSNYQISEPIVSIQY